MTERATQRPAPFTTPPHWSTAPAPTPQEGSGQAEPETLSPTRYGDWVKDGIAVDF